MQPTVEFNLQPSRIGRTLLGLLYGLAAVMACVVELSFVYRGVLFGLVVTSAALAFWRAGLYGQQAIVRLRKGDADIWFLTQRGGRVLRTELRDSACFISAWLVVLNYLFEGRRIPVVLIRDAVPADQFRRLRVALGLRRGLV